MLLINYWYRCGRIKSKMLIGEYALSSTHLVIPMFGRKRLRIMLFMQDGVPNIGFFGQIHPLCRDVIGVWKVLKFIVRTCMTMIKPKTGQMQQEEETVDETVKQGFN